MHAENGNGASLHDQLVDVITFMRLPWSALDCADVISVAESETLHLPASRQPEPSLPPPGTEIRGGRQATRQLTTADPKTADARLALYF